MMKKLIMLGMISSAALLTAAPFSLQWSQKTVAVSFDTAEARIGRPGTAFSIAGVGRRAYRRSVRSAVYAGAVGAVGYGAYSGGYGYPAYSYSAASAPYYGTGYGSYYGGYAYPAYGYGSYYGGYSTAPYNPGPNFGWRW
jgi:hypothetical protein